jgi:hypothetical protein
MGRAGRLRVAGPLAAFADGFDAELERLGYSRFTAEAQLQHRPLLVRTTTPPAHVDDGVHDRVER